MSDPAVEAATRVMKLVYAYPTPNRDLVVAAREVLKPIRELHHPIDEHGDSVEECSECRHRWPCDTAKLIYTSEELQTECELLAEDICDEAEESELIADDDFMELGEFLDTATAEELAAIRQHTEVSRADLELHLRWYTTARVSPEVVAQSLLETYRITPR